jgi:hypothetical protein
VLVRVLEREGLSGAWVGYLPSAWNRDPAAGNDALFASLAPYRQVLQPAGAEFTSESRSSPGRSAPYRDQRCTLAREIV